MSSLLRPEAEVQLTPVVHRPIVLHEQAQDVGAGLPLRAEVVDRCSSRRCRVPALARGVAREDRVPVDRDVATVRDRPARRRLCARVPEAALELVGASRAFTILRQRDRSTKLRVVMSWSLISVRGRLLKPAGCANCARHAGQSDRRRRVLERLGLRHTGVEVVVAHVAPTDREQRRVVQRVVGCVGHVPLRNLVAEGLPLSRGWLRSGVLSFARAPS